MTLFEVLNEFKAGRKIRRESWNPNLWIEFRSAGSVNGEPVQGLTRLYMNHPEEGVKLLEVDSRYSTEDVLATDWAFYND